MILHRRDNPPKYAEYGRYKPLLRADFCYRCGYCRTHESTFGSVRNMTIDHFRPRSRFPRLAAEYSNLHYCCSECNTYKGDRWPTDDELANEHRFIDACVDDVDDHYEYVDLVIKPRTSPGEFTAAVLRLDRPMLLTRRRAIAARRAEIAVMLDRIERIRIAAVEDPGTLLDVDAVRADVLDQLHALDNPSPLTS